jgi:hypothetical protein
VNVEIRTLSVWKATFRTRIAGASKSHAGDGVIVAKEALGVGFVTILLPGFAMGAVLAVLARTYLIFTVLSVS